jgi:ferritin
MSRFTEALNDQIASEFAASQQYCSTPHAGDRPRRRRP